MQFVFSPYLGVLGAAVLGGAVGMQRQAAHKPAGLRTHILVATAAAAFVAMGAHLHDTRIPSYVIVGIGFLGGGAIVRQGPAAHGLTTAASIWMAAAIGLALGYADAFGLFIGLLATALTIGALSLSDEQVMHVFRIPRRAMVRVTCVPAVTTLDELAGTFAASRVVVESSDVSSAANDGAGETLELVYDVVLPPHGHLSSVVREIGALDGVRNVVVAERAGAS